jgi:cytochrome P450
MVADDQICVPLTPDDPWSLIDQYAAWRERSPFLVVRLPSGDQAYLATRHAEVEAVLGDGRFSTDMGRPGAARLIDGADNSHRPFADPPEHTRWRNLISKAFTPRQVERLRPEVERIVDRLLDDLEDSGPPADLMSQFAVRLSISVLCHVMGIPDLDVERFRVWLDTAFALEGPSADEKIAALASMAEYAGALITEKRANLQGDLASRLIAARDDEDGSFTQDELVMTVMILLIGGYENTARQFGRAVLALFRRPDQLAKLRANPGLITSAVEEVLRFAVFDTAIGNPRFATEEVTIGGTVLPRDCTVLVQRQSANWDGERFDCPAEFRIDRKQEHRHFAFGYGAHYCVGAALARLELGVGLTGLLHRFPGLALAVVAHDVPWEFRVVASGPVSLPVTW